MGSSEIIKIGTVITIGGEKYTIGAVLYIGERYYCLQDKLGYTFLLPATVVEQLKIKQDDTRTSN